MLVCTTTQHSCVCRNWQVMKLKWLTFLFVAAIELNDNVFFFFFIYSSPKIILQPIFPFGHCWCFLLHVVKLDFHDQGFLQIATWGKKQAPSLLAWRQVSEKLCRLIPRPPNRDANTLSLVKVSTLAGQNDAKQHSCLCSHAPGICSVQASLENNSYVK